MTGKLTAICRLIVAAVSIGVTVSPAAIVTGTVTQNGSLYTYSYTLNNTAAAAITELSILVDYRSLSASIAPNSHVDPANWAFQMTFSGSIAGPPYNEVGSFWAWNTFASPLLVGQTLTGFSFTTPYAPAPGNANNYFVFCGACGGDGIAEYGHIVAPDITPEPSLLLPAGLAGLALLSSLTSDRRRRPTSRASE